MEYYAKAYATKPDKALLKALEDYDSAIYMPLAIVRKHMATDGADVDSGVVVLAEWIEKHQRASSSIYSCYK
jgi:hypothetical protein